MPPPPTTPRWQDVLLAISKSSEDHRYCERLVRVVKGSRSYLREVVRQLALYRLIEIQPTTKIKRLCLTDKGRKVIQSIQDMQTQLRVL